MSEQDLFTEDEKKTLEEQMKLVEGLDLSSTQHTRDFLENYQNQFNYGNENTIKEKIQIPERNEIVQNKLDLKIHKNKKDNDSSSFDSNVKARFPYYDENGKIKYRISRFYEPNKDGNLYAVDSLQDDGSFKPGAKGIPRIPYNIPEMLKQKGRVIFILNGEDKVETVKKLGFIATTAAFSSPQKWERSFNKYLANGSYIIILADNKEDTTYTKFLDHTLEIIQEDFENVGRIDIADYFDFFGVEASKVRTLTDLVQLVPKEKIIEFLTNIEMQLKGGVA